MKSPAIAAATATVLSLATAEMIPMVDLVAVNCPGGTESQRQFTFNLNYDEASKFGTFILSFFTLPSVV
jgi:hypothetical protein